MKTNARLSRNFWLSEFLQSQTAQRHGIDMTPTFQVIANLTRLCQLVLQPLRSELDTAIMITSGYRPRQVNRIIGGSDVSQHIEGLAADFVVLGHPVDEVFRYLCRSGLPFDQLIHEFGEWVHVSVSFAGSEPRGQTMMAAREEGEVRYRLVKV